MKKQKPPYRVPSMKEIEAIQMNGFNMVSTFSGCGGSCLGFRMAGFNVLWANEFIPEAAKTYRANHPEVILDQSDIRKIDPKEILKRLKLKPGQVDVFNGSPPCASFSTAGKREKYWGKAKKYSDTVQRTDDLFFEYIRLIKGLMPKVFVAENVSGLVKGVAKGYFLEILKELKACGYRVECKVLDAMWLGVPQQRQRTIFIGVREDLKRAPAFPKPLPYFYTLRDALPWIAEAKYGKVWRKANQPSPTVSASQSWNPETSSQWLELVKSYLSEVASLDFSRHSISKEWDKLKPGQSSSKYFNLVKPSMESPCPTICASHGQVGIAGVTHPLEKRKLAIAELKRICAFPDDFILTGKYSQQWERLGRAVPPVMMYHIAKTILNEILI